LPKSSASSSCGYQSPVTNKNWWLFDNINAEKNMKNSFKIYLTLGLFLVTSCTSLHEFVLKAEFDDVLKNSTKISKGLKSTSTFDKVEIVKAKDVSNLIEILSKFQKEMPNYYPLAIAKRKYCSYNTPFLINEDSLREFAKSKNFEFVVYLDAKGVKNYIIRKDNLGQKIESLKIEKSDECSLFEAYFYSKDVTDVNPVETIRY
jgi:hypothetical protein